MKGYEAVYGFSDEPDLYKPSIKLHYPGLTWYLIQYGTPDDPQAGKKALLNIALGEIDWTPRPLLGKPTPSVGLFQQHESSWAR